MRNGNGRKSRAVLVGAMLALGGFGVFPGVHPISPAYAGNDVEHGLATHHVVVQISDGDAKKQQLVLNNLSNMLAYFGQDSVQIEVVAFGPGLRLLLKDNVHAEKVRRLAGSGVEFAACQNTMKAMHLTKADLNPVSTVVPGGIVEIMKRESEGWNYIRP